MNGRLPLYCALSAGCALFAGILFLRQTAPHEAGSSAIQAAVRQGVAPAPSRAHEVRASAGLGDARLTGIVTVPHHRIAIFAVRGANPLVVSEGDNVSGWRVDSITPDEVAVTGPGGTKTLRPKSDPALAAPSQPIRQAAAGTVPSGPPTEEMPIPPGVRSPGVSTGADMPPDMSTAAEMPPGFLYPGVVLSTAVAAHSPLAHVPRLRAGPRLEHVSRRHERTWAYGLPSSSLMAHGAARAMAQRRR
jgi:hypothetical protein